MKYIILIILMILSFSSQAVTTHVTVTRDQNFNDKWLRILPKDSPFISSIKNSYIGEKIFILVFVADYNVNKKGEASLFYDIDIVGPKGGIYYSEKDNLIAKGKTSSDGVLLSGQLTVMQFETQDEIGKYSFRINVKDNIGKNNVVKEINVNLHPNIYPKHASKGKHMFDDYFKTHYRNLNLEFFYSYFDSFLSISHSLGKEEKESIIFFFYQIIKENPFLSWNLDEYTLKQGKRNKELIFRMMKTLGHIPKSKEMKKNVNIVKKLHNPYSMTSKGFHLDMLWSDFFATGKFQPILSLVFSMENNITSNIVEKKAIGGAAKWSLELNSKHSKLVCQYLRYINYHKSKMKIMTSSKILENIATSCMKNFKHK